jgi:hypothetical protein
MRLAAHAAVGVLDADQAYYRLHGQNMHKQTFTDAMTVLEQHRKAFLLLFEEHGSHIPTLEQLRELAKRTLALGALRRAGKAFEAGDQEACQRFMDYALAHCPRIREESAWFRLTLKRAIGFRLWVLMRPAIRAFRGKKWSDPSPFVLTGIFPGV